MTYLSPSPKFKATQPGTINPLSGGLLYTYAAGASPTPGNYQATYKDSAGTPNTNPVVLDTNGECDLWLGPLPYKYVLQDSLFNTLWTIDNIVSGSAIVTTEINKLFVSTYAALSTTVAVEGQIVTVKQHTSGGVGGGDFIGVSGSVASDGGTKINSATANIYWQRMDLTFLHTNMFGIFALGIVDEGALYQKFIDACCAYNLVGRQGVGIILSTIPIVANGSLTLIGDESELCVLKQSGSIVTPLFRNSPYPTALIYIKNVTIDGGTVDRDQALVAMYSVANLYLASFVVKNSGYSGVEIAGCSRVTIAEASKFIANGKVAHTADGGAAIRFTDLGGVYNDLVTIDACTTFLANRWSGLFLTKCTSSTISGSFVNNGESSIFTYLCPFVHLTNININGATLVDISAHGIELSYTNFKITNTTVMNVAGYGISCNASSSGQVDNVLLGNCATGGGVGAAYVAVSSTDGQTKNLQFNNITISSDTGIIPSAFLIFAGVNEARNISIDNLDLGDCECSGDIISCLGSAISNDFQIGRIMGVGNKWQNVHNLGGYVSGRYYTGEYLNPTSANTLAMAANTLYFSPAIIRGFVLWTKIAVNVTSLAAGKLVRIGIYKMSNGIPTTLVLDCGAVSVAANGIAEITISKFLPPSIYCFAIVSDGTPTLSSGQYSANIFGASVIAANDNRMSAAFAYGALPSVAPTVTRSPDDAFIVAMRTGV